VLLKIRWFDLTVGVSDLDIDKKRTGDAEQTAALGDGSQSPPVYCAELIVLFEKE